ncbi:drug/metabolite transporter (DMT)-like permease [Clostridium algifaecis]|uniref:Drug/metabolite transporter (DMT)-like permease n=1 Tax=Clostridium algifaecis TaxID=1472040 RepID=A0ABS4KU78_9CLOT|nr:EamA family transporter [Clostridium algifaecis]MBP2033595.1 drug/metabolite transporter (DMT)-like permease [Clostridium algifaecis]
MENRFNKTHIIVLTYAFITVILWASAFVFTKVAFVSFTPEALGSVRYLFASIFLLVFAIIKKISLPKPKDIPMFFLTGLLGFALYVYAFNKGSVTVTASTASVLTSTAPIITAILAVIFYKERINKICWIAIALEFLGIIIIALNDGIFSINKGVEWILTAAFCISLYNIIQRKLLKEYTPLESTTYSIFAGTILLTVFLKDGLAQLWAAPMLQIVNVICLGFLPGAIAYLFWVTAISKAKKVTTVTNFMFITPLLSTIMGLIVIKEVPSHVTIIGGCIIIGASILFQKLNKL